MILNFESVLTKRGDFSLARSLIIRYNDIRIILFSEVDPMVTKRQVEWVVGVFLFAAIAAVPAAVLITDNEFNQRNPAISGPWVAFEDYRNGNWDIWVYNIKTRDIRPICQENSNQRFPSISGNIVVWEDWRNGEQNKDIYGYNLDTDQELIICSRQGNQTFPAIHENRIVWQDTRSGNPEIYLYDLNTQQETTVVTASDD
jgi:beta propeller repeat protein